MTIKNKFAILNLVKSFLTFITFDSLSRKIKISCLVINKFIFKEDIQMSNIKILSAVLSFLLLFVISCSNEDTTGGNGGDAGYYTHSNHPPEGTYKYPSISPSTDEIATVKIVNGNCNIMGKVKASGNSSYLEYDITVTSWYTIHDYPNLSSVSTIGGVRGESTIAKPTNPEYYEVQYDTSNESIKVSLKTTDGIHYSAIGLTLTKDLKYVNQILLLCRATQSRCN